MEQVDSTTIYGVELLPCPFCGGVAAVRNQDYAMTVFWFVYCRGCKSSTTRCPEGRMLRYKGRENYYVTAEEADQDVAQMWNMRTEKRCSS